MIPTEFKNIIKKHLDKVASKDAVFASKYDASDKSLDECCTFIMKEAKKAADKENMICLADKVVYGWAVHFFDEKEPSKAVEDVNDIVKSRKQKEVDFNARQLSLFDVASYESKF